ncbi:Him1p LALA0_S05e01970g [Lachancea lanzarotensis]|uniref:LALA0S05e01970g1_1 n=1 Tax=Lachancea lanzarotensis TaxID=1245769 RepID=A0A0C7MX35_9SACH|nr:uncharacterized protein LALA0_S05e01970g [Lachancea lanzarotensis]CEP62279.1 LALA0S05e01970g1_1 [Lachancea lanzarotensis]
MSSRVASSELRESALRNRLRERTGSIFKSRHESGMGRSQGISHEQILISSSPTSLAQIAKNLDGDILGFSKHRTVDNIMVLGATGLTGSLIIANLIQPWIYLNSTNEIQRKLDNLGPSTELLDKNNHFFKRPKQPLCNVLTRKKTVEITKNVFCFSRKPIEPGTVGSLSEHDSGWEHSIRYRGSTLLCRYENFECDEPVVSMGYVELPVSLQQQEEKTAIEMHVQQYSYRLKYENSQDEHGQTCRHTLTVELKINVVSLIEKDSEKWPELFKTLFGEEPTTASVVTKKLEQTMLWNFPSLKQVGTIISALGSSDHQQRTTNISRSFVDYDLNMQMIQVFSQSKDVTTPKKAVVITSFNNLLLSSVSRYFNTKLSLEQDLATRVPGLDKLIILRPGPLVGSHSSNNTGDSSLQETKPAFIPETLFAIYRVKRSCLRRKIRFARDLSTYGLKLKLGEIVARIAYHRSCSPLIGYVVPAYKVAYVAVLKSLYLTDGDGFVEVIKSDKIDHLT